MPQIRNIWEELGFAGNPFHTDPLKATEGDSHVYVHRDRLESTLGTWLASEERGGIFVEGTVGVGKTTFVNQTQLSVHQHDPATLPCDDVVEIQDDTTSVELVLSLCATILRALQDYREGVARDNAFQEVEQEVRRTRVAAWNAGLTIAGIGAEGGRQVTTTEPVAVTLHTMRELLDKVEDLLHAQGFDKAIVPLNNLDNVEMDHLWGTLHDVRDTLLQRRGMVFVFIGPPGLRAHLASHPAHRRISEVVSHTVVEVGSLSREDTWAVIDARVNAYVQAAREPPVSRKLIEALYDASGGELRYVLNRASDITQFVARSIAMRGPIDDEAAFAALYALVRRDVDARHLSERRMDVLETIVRHGQAQTKDYEDFGFNNAPAFSNHLAELTHAGLLEKRSNPRDAREIIYKPRGDASLYFTGKPVQGA